MLNLKFTSRDGMSLAWTTCSPVVWHLFFQVNHFQIKLTLFLNVVFTSFTVSFSRFSSLVWFNLNFGKLSHFVSQQIWYQVLVKAGKYWTRAKPSVQWQKFAIFSPGEKNYITQNTKYKIQNLPVLSSRDTTRNPLQMKKKIKSLNNFEVDKTQTGNLSSTVTYRFYSSLYLFLGFVYTFSF